MILPRVVTVPGWHKTSHSVSNYQMFYCPLVPRIATQQPRPKGSDAQPPISGLIVAGIKIRLDLPTFGDDFRL